ncbi:MAG: hypothetical protein ABJD11_18180 [Gemmatimonadota bacterium]
MNRPLSREHVCTITTALIQHVGDSYSTPHQIPQSAVELFHVLVTQAKSSGIKLEDFARGKWQVETDGTRGSRTRPAVVSDGWAMVDHDLAWDVAALLNWCGAERPTTHSVRVSDRE